MLCAEIDFIMFARIWEKKYGKNANHVKKERELPIADNRKHFQGSKHSQTNGRVRPRQGGGTAAQSQFNEPPSDKGWPRKKSMLTQAPGTDKPKDVQALHPSWEAKRRLKEKLNPSIVPAAGKKTVF